MNRISKTVSFVGGVLLFPSYLLWMYRVISQYIGVYKPASKKRSRWNPAAWLSHPAT